MANVHLPSSAYGPYALRDGSELTAVLQQERTTRAAAMKALLPAWEAALSGGVPLVVTGDFNTPSHLDWTPAAVDVRSHHALAVRWPTTLALEHAGFVDTYREVHTDAVAVPGVTWTRGYPHPRLLPDEVCCPDTACWIN